MRTLMKVSFPVETANRALREGALPRAFDKAIAELRPEATYFYAENGRRTAIVVFELKDSSQIPLVTEPLFHGIEAEIDLYPVMNAEELKKGLDKSLKTLER